MKLSFQDQYTIAQEISGLSDAASTTKFKRDINTGGAMLQNCLERPYNRTSRTSNTVAAQQYYQVPEDCLRVTEVMILSSATSTWRPPLIQVSDEFQWARLNQFPVNGIPRYFFIRGFDEVGLYPIPTESITDGFQLVFEPKYNSLTQDDFTTGTATIANNSQTVTHSATGFSAAMIGRWFTVTDGTDQNWYRIKAFTDTSTLVLENDYQGTSGGTKSFRICEVMSYIPEEFLEAPTDYAMYRYFLRRGDLNKTNDFKSIFDGALAMARNKYGQVTSDQVIYANRNLRAYNPMLDTPIRNPNWT